MCDICARCSKTMLVFWEILLSLSARRVWIEMGLAVWLLKIDGSLSARRVWIEILLILNPTIPATVTLREEGVD